LGGDRNAGGRRCRGAKEIASAMKLALGHWVGQLGIFAVPLSINAIHDKLGKNIARSLPEGMRGACLFDVEALSRC
jgi:hypothetical protein